MKKKRIFSAEFGLGPIQKDLLETRIDALNGHLAQQLYARHFEEQEAHRMAYADLLNQVNLEVPLVQDSVFGRIREDRFSYLGKPVEFTDADRVLTDMGKPFVAIAIKGEDDAVFGVVYGNKGNDKCQLTKNNLDRCNVIRRPAAAILRSIYHKQQTAENARLAALGLAASEIGHTMKGALVTIVGMVNLLGNKIPTDVLDEHGANEIYGIVREECDRLAHYVNAQLAYARDPRPTLNPFDLETEVRNLTLEIQKTFANSYGYVLPIKIETQPELPFAYAEFLQIREDVLRNIVLNAYEAMYRQDETGGTVTGIPNELTIRLSTADNEIHLEVQNPQKVRPDVLDHLKSGVVFKTTKEKGNGLGFATAVKYAEANGGALTIRSDDEYGTIQELFLPVYVG